MPKQTMQAFVLNVYSIFYGLRNHIFSGMAYLRGVAAPSNSYARVTWIIKKNQTGSLAKSALVKCYVFVSPALPTDAPKMCGYPPIQRIRPYRFVRLEIIFIFNIVNCPIWIVCEPITVPWWIWKIVRRKQSSGVKMNDVRLGRATEEQLDWPYMYVCYNVFMMLLMPSDIRSQPCHKKHRYRKGVGNLSRRIFQRLTCVFKTFFWSYKQRTRGI